MDLDLNITLSHSPNEDECNQLSFDLAMEPELSCHFDENNSEMNGVEQEFHFNEGDSEKNTEAELEAIANITGASFLCLIYSLLIYSSIF